MHKIKLIINGIMLVSVISGCDGQNSVKSIKISKDCIALNDAGFEHLSKYYREGAGAEELDSALSMFKKAVKCDSNYFIAYKSMAETYDDMKNYAAEIGVYDKLIPLTKMNPFYILKKGALYKKINNIDSAKRTFMIADSIFDVELKKAPDNIDLISYKILVKYLIDGKESATKELNREIIKHPKNSSELIKKTGFLGDSSSIKVTTVFK